MTEPQQYFHQIEDHRLCYFRWREEAPKQVLMLHATGFHARCWDQVIAQLPDDVGVVAVDQRGHGRSDETPPFTWTTFGEDIVSLLDALGILFDLGVGHSMGGHCTVQAAYYRPDLFERLLLVDPVILPPELYGVREPMDPRDNPVSRRRGEWKDWREMYERFEDRHPYSLWKKPVLEDYCRYGVLPSDGGTYRLACPPLVEASIYTGSGFTNVHEMIAAIQQPVTVLRAPPRDLSEAGATMDFAASPTWPGLAGAFANGTDVFFPELTHFIPMQEPELVAGYLLETMSR